jgi:hypothetical protein
MELLVATLLLTITGILAQALGTDSRDTDQRSARPTW